MLNNVFINIIMFKYALIFIGGNVMNKGFTLAEVLITLGIIGAVATLFKAIKKKSTQQS